MRDPQLMCLVTPRISRRDERRRDRPRPVHRRRTWARRLAGDNNQILSWIKGLFMNGVKQTLGEFCVKQKVTLIDAIAYTAELSQAFVAHVPSFERRGRCRHPSDGHVQHQLQRLDNKS